jgi:folate-binding protein YgfZ
VSTIAEQVRAARETVLLVAHPDLSTLVVTGADRETWLNGLLTCDVVKAPRGEATYGLAVTQKGRVIADVLVLKHETEAIVVVPSRIRDDLAAQLERYLIMEDAELTKGTARIFCAHGPRSTTFGGIPSDRTGLGGALFTLASDAERDTLVSAVTEAGGIVGDDAGWEALRLERGLPRFGVDFDDKTYPQEASLEKRAVSFDKGCYLGQEVVCMLELRGHVKRKLVSFILDDETAPTSGATITDRDGNEIGKVTSATPSPTLHHTVGLAMLKLAHTAPNTPLRIAGSPAHTVDIPTS